MQHQCNLAAKERGLECTCVNISNFTVLVSGGSKHHWVRMCTVWPSHSKWLKYSNESATNVAWSLNIPPWKLFVWFWRSQLWATGDWQLPHDNVPTHAPGLIQSFLAKHQITQVTQPPLQPRFGTLRLLAFLKTEREEMSDNWWDSGKYNGAADGHWEVPRCLLWRGLRCHCPMYLVPCIFFSKCLYFSYHVAGYLLDRPCIL